MAKVLQLPQTGPQAATKVNAAAEAAMRNIEKRMGVSFFDYMALNGKRSEEVQSKINRSLRKETMQLDSKIIEC
ncbi:hypothetical protein [Paenibacillus thiaminolyticus]|uniref:Uncharacterized protein n=1 Tax=Paenibacillus thiaminolyticus TaxID=49283 RepID=A0A3A3GHJ8_PANTH|nr:hypothetical protein [Paenibacillus thiaminolyticus]RJG21359.1 hypothetical protein DQX05_21920 [Paenibacillus thiaminolyticus]